MEPIKFYIGQESGIVVENKDFDKSIFAEQYKQAFEIFNNIWDAQEKALNNQKTKQDYSLFSNIIAFCGDRGEGKTSLLSSVRTILEDEKIRKNASEKLKIEITPSCSSIKALDLLDPLFFDKNHNLIELLLGQMVAEIIKVDREKDAENKVLFDRRNDLLKKFESAKRRLKILNKDSRQEEYDELENLDDLAASIKLREELDSLFQDYAKYYKAEKLIISLDDIDLNMTEGFQMVEQIRKYLSGLHSCILLIALKVDQMERLVMSDMRQVLNRQMVKDEAIQDMARRYIAKLLPLSNRVILPKGSEIAEKDLVIVDRQLNEYPYGKVKEAVVHLIYQKTRYIFVNRNRISPIVPNNLRDLRLLMADLWDLPDVNVDSFEANTENRLAFKNYFYDVWIKNLSEEDASFVKQVIVNHEISSINKQVVTYLSKKIPKRQYRFNEIYDDVILEEIFDIKSSIYNISLGDVFYALQQLSQFSLEEQSRNLIFFLYSFYSMQLYEAYNDMTLDDCHLYPSAQIDSVSIYKSDIRLQELNLVQRLINGRYFTYRPADFLSPNLNGLARDLRVISTKELRTDIEYLYSVANYKALSKKEQQHYLDIMHCCEFFALTTTHAVAANKNKANTYNYSFDRTNQILPYLQTYTSTTNFLAFDVLSLFSNIVNIKAAYKRISSLVENENLDLYVIALNNEQSLLKQMISKYEKERDEKWGGSELEPKLHGLLSDAIIRFSEVQQSILETAKSQRYIHKAGDDRTNIRFLYKDIKEMKITIYPVKEGESQYTIPSLYLLPIMEFLERVDVTLFNNIYNPIEEVSLPKVIDEDIRRRVFSIFGNELKSLKIRYPKGNMGIQNSIKNHYEYLYNSLGGKTYWDTIFVKNHQYQDYEEVLSSLAPIIDKIENAKGSERLVHFVTYKDDN